MCLKHKFSPYCMWQLKNSQFPTCIWHFIPAFLHFVFIFYDQRQLANNLINKKVAIYTCISIGIVYVYIVYVYMCVYKCECVVHIYIYKYIPILSNFYRTFNVSLSKFLDIFRFWKFQLDSYFKFCVCHDVSILLKGNGIP